MKVLRTELSGVTEHLRHDKEKVETANRTNK